MDARRISSILVVVLYFNLSAAQLAPCTPGNLEYKYTECDADKRRWRVQVPKIGNDCLMNSPKPPALGPECGFTCSAGEYLDMEGDQNCRKCNAGSYSVGDGVRYDQWDTLPEGFSVDYDTGLTITTACNKSSEHGWMPHGDELRGIPNNCMIALTKDLDIVKDGKITIEYKNTFQRDTVFIVQMKGWCSSGTSSSSDYTFLEGTPTGQKSYSSVEIKITRGKYKFMITMLNMASVHVPGSFFSIKAIEVQGTEFTSSCALCEPGTYSSNGASSCSPCTENTYSARRGSATCQQCEGDTYSPLGSSECIDSPPCTSSDYFAHLAPCENDTTHMIYSWMEPKICNSKLDRSVDLPTLSPDQSCPPCNPGQSLNSQGVCEYCQLGTFSDGSASCDLCPINTEAVRSLTFNVFEVLPDRMSTGCVLMSGDGALCNQQMTWIPRSTYLEVSQEIFGNRLAVLSINVSGLSNETIDGRNYGSLSLKFDMNCELSGCELFILKTMESGDVPSTLQRWNITGTGIELSYNFTEPDVTFISVVFGKSPGSTASSTDNMRLYELSVVNTKEGGASGCTDCVVGGSKAGCHGCGMGEYIAVNNRTREKTCKKCPHNHILADAFTCQPCGEGLVANDDLTLCLSNCQYTSPDSMNFDFTSLAGIHEHSGISLFSGDGSSYHNTLNFVLCSPSSQSKSVTAVCVNNITDAYYWDETSNVNSLVCKSTILPSDPTPVSFQPLSIGDVLTSVTTNDESERDRLVQQGLQIDDDELTVHFNYATATPTTKCSQGVNSTITLKCDLREKDNGTLSFPKRCIGGTCDGCHYSLVWVTSLACPQCTESDYKKIVGACNNGEQSITYLPNTYCPMSDEMKSKEHVQPCSMVPMPVKLGIAGSALIGVFLLVCAICCWKRSRKLEYKYMKLVEGAQGGGELPAAQTCAWSDDEEELDADKVAFKTKGDQLFGKLGNNDKNDGFEKMKLVGSSLPEI